MNTPEILYYAYMTYSTQKGKETPRYTITKEAGYYKPMEALIGRDGKVSFFLLKKLKEGINVPSVWLQAKSSLNVSGLIDYFTKDGKLSGFAYGYPFGKETYSSKKKPNPFYGHRKDGFLFIIHQDGKEIVPTSIELIVLKGVKDVISGYCKMLIEGGFDEALRDLREAANS